MRLRGQSGENSGDRKHFALDFVGRSQSFSSIFGQLPASLLLSREVQAVSQHTHTLTKTNINTHAHSHYTQSHTIKKRKTKRSNQLCLAVCTHAGQTGDVVSSSCVSAPSFHTNSPLFAQPNRLNLSHSLLMSQILMLLLKLILGQLFSK